MEKSLEKVLSVLLSKGMIISATYIVAAFILVVVLNHLSKKYREKIDPADIRLNAFVRSVFNTIKGIVVVICLFAVLQDLNTGNTVVMCNRNITQVAKVNGIYDIDLQLAYSEDPDRVKEVFSEAAKEIAKNKGITRAEYLGIQRYEASGVIYRIRYYCSPKIHWPMLRASMAIIQRYIIASGLEIPYPQMDVHHRNM